MKSVKKRTYGLKKLGIINPTRVYRNLSPAILVEKAIERGGHKAWNSVK